MPRPWLRKLLLVASCSAALSSWSTAAQAYCRTTTQAALSQTCTTDGIPLFWRNECRGVRVDLAPIDADLHAAYTSTLQAALAEWSESPCPGSSGKASISIDYLGETSTDFVGYKEGTTNENAVFFRTDDWVYADDKQVALTTVTFRSDTGDILDADIEVNSTLDISTADPLPARGFDLKTVFAHELGHVLGLAHSENRAATMFATYNPGTTEQGSLDDDDREGLCSIYLPNGKRSGPSGTQIEAETCDPEAEPLQTPTDDGCGCRTSGGHAPFAYGLTALGVLALLRRRRVRAA